MNKVIGTVHADPRKIYDSVRFHIEHTPEVLKKVKEKYKIDYEEIDRKLNKIAQYEAEDMIKEAAESKRKLIKEADVVYFESNITNKEIIDMQLYLIAKEENKKIKYLDGTNKKYGPERKSIDELVKIHSEYMGRIAGSLTDEQMRGKDQRHLIYDSVQLFIKGDYKGMYEKVTLSMTGGLPMTEEQKEMYKIANEALGRRDRYWKIPEKEGILVIAGAAHEEYVRTVLLAEKEESKLEGRMAAFFGDDF